MRGDESFDLAVAPKRNSFHWRQESITWDELVGWLDEPALKKECGNYFPGLLRETTIVHPKETVPCTHLHRRKPGVVSRSMIALDVDHPEPGFIDNLELTAEFACLVHTTHSSSPDDLRFRILVPTDRDMTPDEYYAASTALVRRYGESQFDSGTTEFSRYMFKPATQHLDWFQSWVFDAEPASVEALIAEYGEFEDDLSTKPMPSATKRKRDPFEMDGAVGAFNKAYDDLNLLIEEYELPYESSDADRWKLVGARSEAGMGEVAPGLFYSHHVSDPAYGKTCTAFDLVRLHRFGDLDEAAPDPTPINRLPSHKEMLELAMIDARVVSQLAGIDFAEDMEDVAVNSDWKLLIRRSAANGKMIDTISNWDLIMENEPVFQALYFNEFSLSVEIDQDLPWRTIAKEGVTFNGNDRVRLGHHIEREFGIRMAKEFVTGLADAAASRRYINPVREYLDGLEWDGEPRMETCLPGVTPTEYTRLVARKSLVAAVARIYEPGCKWDHTLILFGPEGLGKTFWIDRMSRGWQANLGAIGDKDTLLTMQRSWIMVSDEGQSLRKAEADATKEFLTRREDVFRLPYDREAQPHPRHCVIWGTTNDEIFLRRQEGNRRFLIVHCEERADFAKFQDGYVDQVWAEAVHYYRAGELLYLADDESALAASNRESFIEEDALAGVIEEFLEQKVPKKWDAMTPEARMTWMSNRDDKLVDEGSQVIMSTCSAQIWVEALGKRFGDHKRTDLLEITKSLRRLGWIPRKEKSRVGGYGTQVVFDRPLIDLI